MNKIRIKIFRFFSFIIIMVAVYGISLGLNKNYMKKVSDFSYVILQDIEVGNYENRFLKICKIAEDHNVFVFCIDITEQNKEIVLYGNEETCKFFVKETGIEEGLFTFPFLGYEFKCGSYQDFIERDSVSQTQKLYLYNPDGRYFTDIFYDGIIVYNDSGMSYEKLNNIKLFIWIVSILLMFFLLMCNFNFSKKTFLVKLLNGISAYSIMFSNLASDGLLFFTIFVLFIRFKGFVILGKGQNTALVLFVLLVMADIILQFRLFYLDFKKSMIKNPKSRLLISFGYIVHSLIIITAIFFLSFSQTSVNELKTLLSMKSYFDSYNGRALIQFQFSAFDGDANDEINSRYYDKEKDNLNISVWQKYYGEVDIIAANENSAFLLSDEILGNIDGFDFENNLYVFYKEKLPDNCLGYLDNLLVQYESCETPIYCTYYKDFETMCFQGFDYGDSGTETYSLISNPVIVIGKMKKETPTVITSSIIWNEGAAKIVSEYVKECSLLGYIYQDIYAVYMDHVEKCILNISLMILLVFITMILEIYVCSFLIVTETNMKALEYALLKIQGFGVIKRYKSFCAASLISLFIGLVTSSFVMYELYEVKPHSIVPICSIFVAADFAVIIYKLIKWEKQNLVSVLKGADF